MNEPSFNTHSLYTWHSDCSTKETYLHSQRYNGSLDKVCCMSTAGNCWAHFFCFVDCSLQENKSVCSVVRCIRPNEMYVYVMDWLQAITTGWLICGTSGENCMHLEVEKGKKRNVTYSDVGFQQRIISLIQSTELLHMKPLNWSATTLDLVTSTTELHLFHELEQSSKIVDIAMSAGISLFSNRIIKFSVCEESLMDYWELSFSIW